MDPAKNFWGGYAVARDKILVTRPAITTFLSEFRGKTGINLLKRPAAGDFFLENNLFSSNFQAFLVLPGGVITPPGYGLGGLQPPLTPPVDPSLLLGY